MTDATDDELVELCTSVWIEAIGDGQEEANMATARACYNRGRADLLSELKAVLGPFLEGARETEWDDRSRVKNTWLIDDAVIKKLIALAEAGWAGKP